MGPVLSILSSALFNQLANRVLNKGELNGASVLNSAANNALQDKLRSSLQPAKTDDLINHGV